ncbi:hypothetical protein AMAG_15294 [Allomyces macrogynus ATCC 38327]|uniref:Pentatricopeptide repeat-containing protein-mitochondrial domain-containing protein n=1 Tax=Allomyces macrogynus (strain ATCC 38327) TaxID=578462 RepID=A0A0L0T922_ALLM3|nr:hypothetical protein AMAG_15294 [Allomyces macrogynus ATCC 38327]|eukprot:KNE71039.1 hypothetical protein AMAG_15294 [Allomyces macrogynus ATCC 38327]
MIPVQILCTAARRGRALALVSSSCNALAGPPWGRSARFTSTAVDAADPTNNNLSSADPANRPAAPGDHDPAPAKTRGRSPAYSALNADRYWGGWLQDRSGEKPEPEPDQLPTRYDYVAEAEHEFRAHMLNNRPSDLLRTASYFMKYGTVFPFDSSGKGPKFQPRPSQHMYHMVLWALAKGKMPERAAKVLEEMSMARVPRDPTAWAYYIAACGAIQDAERVRQAHAALLADGFPVTGRPAEALVLAYLRCSEFDRAMVIVRDVRARYLATAKGLGRTSDAGVGRPTRWTPRHQNKDTKIDLDTAWQEARPNAQYLSRNTMRWALKLTMDAGRIADVAELYLDMQEDEHIMPLMWADLTRAFARHDYVEFAHQALHRLLSMTKSLREHAAARSSSPPANQDDPGMRRPSVVTFLIDEGTFTAVLEMAGRTARPQLAAQILQIMQDEKMTVREHHFACIVQAFAGAKDFNSVFRLLGIMRRAGMDPHDAARQLLVPMAPPPQAMQGTDPVPAPSLLEGPLSDPRTLIRVLTDRDLAHATAATVPAGQRTAALAHLTDLHKAVTLLPALPRPIDIECVNVLIDAAHRLRADELGLAMYRDLAALDLKPNRHTVHAALACARRDSTTRAKILDDMHAHGLAPDDATYLLLAAAVLDAGEFDQALGILELAKRAASTGKPTVSRSLYMILVRAAVSRADARWKRLVRELRDAGWFLDTRTAKDIAKTFPNDPDVVELAQGGNNLAAGRDAASDEDRALQTVRTYGWNWAAPGVDEDLEPSLAG